MERDLIEFRYESDGEYIHQMDEFYIQIFDDKSEV